MAALTKADLGEHLFNVVGLNKREAKEIVEQFFEDYEDLYLDIPLEGEGTSHKYLIERSSELVEVQEALLDIQPLLDEIAELRDQLLEANKKVVDLEIELANEKAGLGNDNN